MRCTKKGVTHLFFLVLPLIGLLIATITLGISSVCEAGQPKRVMMLHSFGIRFKPWSDYAEAIRTEIVRQSQTPVDFLDHSLVNARVNDELSEDPFVEYLTALYVGRPLDLIVAIGAPAASFVQRHRQRLFPKTPMVFTTVEQRRVQYEQLTENDTVVAVANDYTAVFDNILRVLPLTKTIAIVNGASPNEIFWLGEMQRELAPFEHRLQLRWYNDLSFEAILKEAASLPPHSAIFWSLMNVDAAGVVHEAGSAMNRLSSSANAPIFSYEDVFFGEGIIGGPMHSVVEGSRITANVAVRILDGEKAGNIKTPPVTFASPKFDWRQLERWEISESKLPSGSRIYFRSATTWETYRSQILVICTVILLQCVLIILLLLERRRRHYAEVESRQRMMELAHVNRYSTAGELAASIAHEINQPLGAILANTETAELMLSSQSPDLGEMKEILADIRHDDRRASEVIRRLRSFVTKAPFERRRIDLNDQVVEAIKFLSGRARSRGVTLRSDLMGTPIWINGDPIQLQQVLSNLILNGIDSVSDTTLIERSVTVTTTREEEFGVVTISDTGPGVHPDNLKKVFDPFFSTKEHGMGMGLSIARTIVTAHAGQIEVENRNGAVFRIRLPLTT
jgi:signal transduction histidine kinase